MILKLQMTPVSEQPDKGEAASTDGEAALLPVPLGMSVAANSPRIWSVKDSGQLEQGEHGSDRLSLPFSLIPSALLKLLDYIFKAIH